MLFVLGGFLILTVGMLLAYMLIPTPSSDMGQQPSAAGLNDINFTTNSNGRSIPILYGTVWVSGNILYYGNLKVTPIYVCS